MVEYRGYGKCKGITTEKIQQKVGGIEVIIDPRHSGRQVSLSKLAKETGTPVKDLRRRQKAGHKGMGIICRTNNSPNWDFGKMQPRKSVEEIK